MQKAVPVGEGAMAALLGLDLRAGAEDRQAGGGRDQAGLRHRQRQFAGPGRGLRRHTEAVERAIAIATEQGVKRSIMLPVSAPFHCALMQPAADAMEEALANATIRQPAVPVIANVTAQPVSDPATIAKLLVQAGDRDRALARDRSWP